MASLSYCLKGRPEKKIFKFQVEEEGIMYGISSCGWTLLFCLVGHEFNPRNAAWCARLVLIVGRWKVRLRGTKVSWIDRMPCWVRWLLCYSRESTRKTRKLRAVGLNWLLDEREKDAAHNRIDDDVACAHQLTGRLVLPRLAPPSHSDDWFVSTYQFTT